MIIVFDTKWKRSISKKEGKKWFNDDFQKENKKKQRNVKFQRGFKEAKIIGTIFVKSIGKQVMQPETLVLGGLIGLGQGMKYNGNVKRGVVAGLITLGVMGGLCGIVNVAKHVEEKIKAK